MRETQPLQGLGEGVMDNRLLLVGYRCLDWERICGRGWIWLMGPVDEHPQKIEGAAEFFEVGQRIRR